LHGPVHALERMADLDHSLVEPHVLPAKPERLSTGTINRQASRPGRRKPPVIDPE
jgi:hypothetical protein